MTLRELRQDVNDAAVAWWSLRRPPSMDVVAHLADPTAGLEDRPASEQELAKRVAALVAAGIAKDQVAPGRGHRSKQPDPEAEVMVCSKCETVKPIEEFTERPDRPGKLWTTCDGCRATAQRSRYLSVHKIEALDQIGVAFVVQDGDEVAGLKCTLCHDLIRVGDAVHGTAAITHDVCP